MEKILMIHGIGHDKMGKEPGLHTVTMEELNDQLTQAAVKISVEMSFYQSNEEDEVCGKILSAKEEGFAGILFNPATWMENGEAIAKALSQTPLPVVELHMTNTCKQANSHNVIAPSVTGLVTGFGEMVYTTGLQMLVEYLRQQ
ncbi:MAG: type II 3-dehydroquinate dehydratase [Lachnospiraceae bacterium]|nr:type II 3-dehydroquinate dehydratase [Lachnospiraceae bacterium]